MCEHCNQNSERREEILHCNNSPIYDDEFKLRSDETVDYEIKIWLDIDDGLMIQDSFDFNNLTENCSTAKYGAMAKFDIKYCPWCGEKLRNNE